MYLLDTNHCSYIINGSRKKPEYRKTEERNVLNVLQTRTPKLYTCDVVVGELYYGAEMNDNPVGIYNRIDRFLETVRVLVTDKECWNFFAKTKAHIEKSGKNIKDFDLLIACIARRYGYVLVSNDLVFKCLPSTFQVENWAV